MEIVLPPGLPASFELDAEGIRVLDPDAAWERRKLRVGLVNLMPNKTVTELQFARLLAGGGHTVAVSLRDRLAGRAIDPPVNDPADPRTRPSGTHPWRAHAELFFRNWLNQLTATRQDDGLPAAAELHRHGTPVGGTVMAAHSP